MAILITPVEAARRLSLSRSRVYELMKEETFPSIRVGGSRRILVSDLMDWVRELRDRQNSCTNAATASDAGA